jgi:hypothetical protein
MRDFIAGLCGGIAQVVIGHPLDTIKTCVQNNLNWKYFTFKDYYRGAKYQLSHAMIKNGTIFPTYFFAKKYTDSDLMAGAFAGLVTTPSQYIFDTIKIKKQTYKPFNLNTLIYNNGKIAVLNREIFGLAIYFKTYSYFKEKEFHPIISGGAAGFTSWLFTYPLDVIRSRQISQNIKMSEAIKIGTLYKGLLPCLYRSVLVNSAIWYVVEKIREY